MIIGVDGNEANVARKVGIGEYAYELLRQFQKSQSENLKFVVYLKENPNADMPAPTSNFRYKIVGPKKMWTQFGLPVSLFLGKRPDVFFTPTHYAPRFSPIPTAISIMDLSFLRFPELFNKKDLYQLVNWTKYSVKNAKKVFTISNFSKDDIINTYGIEDKKVVVTYPGIKPLKIEKNNLKMENLSKKYGINGDYILFVGTLQPRKNIKNLIKAFSKLKNTKIKLLIVGKRGWLYNDILSSPAENKVEDRVKFLDFVDDNDLSLLYKNALCFVLPSLYEGFGLPVLEAMKNGCPVIASNVSSLPEAGGEAALYFDPESVEDIAEKIEKVTTDEKLRQEMIKKGYNQVKKFSWEKTAKETLKVLEGLTNE